MSEIVLPLYSLKSYLECPLQGAARYALRMHEEDDGKDEDSEHEPLSQPFLDRTILLREALWRGRGRYEDVERYYREAYHRAELKGIAPVGPFGEAARRFDLDKLARAVRQINAMGVEGFDQWQQIAVGGAGELADVDRTIPAIVFSINLPTPGTTRRIRLRGKIGPISARMDCSVKLVAGEQQAHARDFLDGFFSAIVLAAAGEKVPPEFTALAVGVKDDIGTDELRRKFRPPSPSAARKYLRSLATDLFCDANDYFLPIEAVGAIKDRDARTSAQIVEAIEYVCEHHRGCRSDYGPVRDGRRFPAPDPAEIPEIIERRFAPVAAIFSKRG